MKSCIYDIFNQQVIFLTWTYAISTLCIKQRMVENKKQKSAKSSQIDESKGYIHNIEIYVYINCLNVKQALTSM